MSQPVVDSSLHDTHWNQTAEINSRRISRFDRDNVATSPPAATVVSDTTGEMFAVSDFESGRKRQVASRFSQNRAEGIDKGPIDHAGEGRVNPFFTEKIQWHNHLPASATDLTATDIVIRGSLSERQKPVSRFTASRDLPLHPSNVWRSQGGAPSGNVTRDLVPGSGLLKCHRGFERLGGFF